MNGRRETLWGVVLIVAYSAAISAADAITKHVATGYAAPQLFGLSGLLVGGFCFLMSRPAGVVPKTDYVGVTAARCALGIAGSLAFFLSFRLLPMAEVFLFIALMPILSAALSGKVLGEPVKSGTWAALGLGCVGLLVLFPNGLSDVGSGHVIALAAAVIGSLSLVLARYLSNRGEGALGQVFYPNLSLGIVMCLALPFVWQPMSWADIALVVAYSVALFAARWLCMAALRLLPVHVATMFMSLQFLWAVWLGGHFFDETPVPQVFAGAAIMIAASFVLVWQRIAPRTRQMAVT
ncbi:EamA-like transporter family protein [Shimia isoporae]|uniref:EamA-like transporter family protein n=1 Tax=Shimia isoporae TaxID=647720 RepID=A0A4R1NMR0_9RHOB|nr:DMT family transporter [Shimia isoporae]TCL09707.1 EamA-like transporter family protein [Shimia isoporae]